MRLTKIVENKLRYNRMARNSDKELYLDIMEHYGLMLTPKQKQVFRDMPSLESVRRLRQKFQEQGMYKADQKVAKTRNYKAMRMQQTSLSYKPKDMEKVLEEQPQAISWLDRDNL